MYFILTCPEPDDARVAQISYLPNELDIDWASGARMPDNLTTPVQAMIERGDDGVLVSLFEVPLPLMNRRLADALNGAGVANIEYFPCVVTVESSGQTHSDMLAFNIVGIVACADLSRSLFEDDGGLGMISMSFDRLVIDEQAAGGLKIFRLAENTQAIIVHQSIRALLEHEGFDDLMFIEPGDWVS